MCFWLFSTLWKLLTFSTKELMMVLSWRRKLPLMTNSYKKKYHLQEMKNKRRKDTILKSRMCKGKMSLLRTRNENSTQFRKSTRKVSTPLAVWWINDTKTFQFKLSSWLTTKQGLRCLICLNFLQSTNKAPIIQLFLKKAIKIFKIQLKMIKLRLVSRKQFNNLLTNLFNTQIKKH